jgi:hypothetical protein
MADLTEAGTMFREHTIIPDTAPMIPFYFQVGIALIWVFLK